MLRPSLPTSILLLATAFAAAGCNLVGPKSERDGELEHYKNVATDADYAQMHAPPEVTALPESPRTIRENSVPQEWWNLTLDEAIQLAVSQSSVLRDLGGTVVRSPANARTILGPAIQATDPRFGMEAALSAFDATLATSVFAEKNDRMVNNFVSSGGARFFQQDLINFQSQLSKTGAAGTQMSLRGTSIYDFNNASFNRFPSTWDTLVDVEVRQPLLQGAGVEFNRIAGPGATPGFINGVVVARVNTDISLVDFETGLRDLVSNVENAYWDLYFAYRDLDAKIRARNASLETWRRIKAMGAAGNPGGSAEREAQAREQYYRFEEDVQNALSGRLQDATITNNGSSGGSFRGVGGVLVSERRLRLATGLPITDGRMIRPADEPTLSTVKFDWGEISADAMVRRPELRRQRLTVKRRELELLANRNFLLPQFDLIGRYRARGLGKGLLGDTPVVPDPADPDGKFGNSSLANLFEGDFDELLMGAEVRFPIGFRAAYAGVRNAQLLLARERALLDEQERQIVHDLSNTYADLQRAYQIVHTTYNRRLAAKKQVDILTDKLAKDIPVNLDTLLDAERRFADADIQYHRSLVEHMLALKNVHFEKGSLLEYGHVLLAENIGPDGLARSEPRPRAAIPETIDYTLPASGNSVLVSKEPVLASGEPQPPHDSAPPPTTAQPPAVATLPSVVSAPTVPPVVTSSPEPNLPLPLGEGRGEGLQIPVESANRATPIGSALPASPAAQLIEQTLFDRNTLAPHSAVQTALPTPALPVERLPAVPLEPEPEPEPPLTRRLPPPTE